MNIQQIRESLKIKWVNYYYENRSWLVKMRVWGTFDGQRRPSSSFILATLSILEPQFDEIFPFILELNNNPDHIVAALGLNFNPDKHLHLVKKSHTSENATVRESSLGLSSQPPSSVLIRDNKPVSSVALAREIEKSFALETRDVKDTSSSTSFSHRNFDRDTTSIVLAAETEIPTSLTVTEVASPGGKFLMSQDDVRDRVAPPSHQTSSLASWIDDFCQGAGWDREEAIFIPF